MDSAFVERVFVDGRGRMHWPWRLAAFVCFIIAANMGAAFIVYPLVSGLLGAAGVRLVAWPWMSLFGVAVAHLLVRRNIDPFLSWAQLGLDRAALGGTGLRLGVVQGAAAILVPSLALVAAGWLSFERTTDSQWLALVASMVFVLAPAALAEELMFRGYAFAAVAERFGAAATLAASSVLFALMHVANPGATVASIASVLVAGCWLGLVRLVTGSVWAAAVAHVAWNASMALVLHAKVSGFAFTTPSYRLVDVGPAWATGGTWGPEGGALAALGMMAATAVLLARPDGRVLFTEARASREIRT